MISVILPVYNGERFIDCAIQSVLAQEYRDFELIVIDDGSTDHTSDILHHYTDPRIRLYRQDNAGPGSARNYAMSLAKGDLFAFIDADDRYMPNKLVVQKETLDRHPEVSVVWGDYYQADQNLQIQRKVTSDFITNRRENLLAYMLFRNVITLPPNIMFRRECFDAGFHYRENFYHDEDYYLLLQLLEKYNFYYIDQPLYIYRRHENNLTNDTQMLQKRELEILAEYSPQKIDAIISATDFSKADQCRLRGKIEMKEEKYNSALSHFQKIPTEQNIWKDHFYIGNNQYYLGNYEEAVKHYEEAQKQEPNAPELYNNLGCAYAMILDSRDKDCFKKSLHLFPAYGDASYNLQRSLDEHTTQHLEYRLTKYELRKSIQN